MKPIPHSMNLELPSLGMICLIELYPFLSGVSYSLHKGTLLGVGAFVGWQKYERLFSSPDFYHSLWFSFIFALFNVVFSYLFGLALALFLNLDFPGRGICRVFLLLPWIVPAVVSIVSWKWLIADSGGLVNIILSDFHLGPIYFLSQGQWAGGTGRSCHGGRRLTAAHLCSDYSAFDTSGHCGCGNILVPVFLQRVLYFQHLSTGREPHDHPGGHPIIYATVWDGLG
jgi:hypothetical protein